MTNKLVVIINSLKIPKIKKMLLYEMKFLVRNCSCLQNSTPRTPFSLSSVLNWICWAPRQKKNAWKWSLIKFWCLCFAVIVWADLLLTLLTPLITSQTNKSSTHHKIIIPKAHAYKSSASKVAMVLFSCKPNVALYVKTFCKVRRQAETVTTCDQCLTL